VDWAHSAPAILAAFLASFVEFVEALTIVLAVGLTRNWRSSLTGAAGGAVVLALLVAMVGPNLTAIPVRILQTAIGILLLVFGIRWLRKAILRAAGVLRLHDEDAIFARQTQQLAGGDALGFVTSFKAVFIEGIEVVFIVIAVGAAGRLLLPAAMGALAAGLVVVSIGFIVHKPLSRVPENLLKLVVGILLMAFGIFWIGEGLGFRWFGGDWSILGLITVLIATALFFIRFMRTAQRR
jgi:Ca2+/H+ antiporter, TMEM165/GDT1 family